MLVLARRCGQSIMVGDEIKVAIVDIRGDKVKLEITAPKHLPIDRQETRGSTNMAKYNNDVDELTYANEPIDNRINHCRGKDYVTVLHRRHREPLVIGDEIEVVIVNVGRGNVRLGIAAPRNIPILRQEIYDAMANCSR